MADYEPIHDGRGLRRDRQGGDRPHSQHNHESRLIMTSGHPENYTSLTDVTTWPDWMLSALDDAPDPVRIAGELIRGTGQRPSAAVSMKRSAFQGEWVVVTDEKGDATFQISFKSTVPRDFAHSSSPCQRNAATCFQKRKPCLCQTIWLRRCSGLGASH